MATVENTDREQMIADAAPILLANGHDLIAVSEWLPGNAPTDYDVDHVDGPNYESRYYRCRKCGQERSRPREFLEGCLEEELPNPVTDGGYSIGDGRMRRALQEDMRVQFGERGPL